MEQNRKFLVSAAPHVRTNRTTQAIMLDVIIALIPVLIASVYVFGVRSLILVAASVATCVIAEFVTQKALKKETTITDLSAVVTGMLLAFNVPVGFPIWMLMFGAVFAIVVVKELFGGIGNNFMNPALAARAVFLASWPSEMALYQGVDMATVATPLSGKPFPMMDLFLGNIPGVIGEVSKLAILLGLAYLLVKRVINIRIPLVYVSTCAVLFLLFGLDLEDTLIQILSGGLLFGGVFMLTDYSTSPMSAKGQMIYAFGAGLLTVIIRQLGGYPEGVSYAILLMNVCTPLIDKYFIPKTFGLGGAK